MPRVIPGGGVDRTADFMARNAAADDALTKLYLTLIARREERAKNEAFQRELLGTRHGQRMEELDYMYGPRGGDPNALNPFAGPGAGADPLATPPAAAPAPQAPLPPRPGDPPAGGFLPGANMGPPTGSFTPTPGAARVPTGAAPDKVSAADDDVLPSNMQLAQGTIPVGGFGQQQQRPHVIPGQRARSNATPGNVPYNYPQRRPRQGPAEFMPIHPQWVQAMSAAEQKYALPKGSLLALYGYENGGGRHLGQSGKSSAKGLFQFTAPLRQQHNIRDEDTLNPGVMIEAAAKNLRHNANSFKQLSGKDLPTDPRFMPYWVALHQWGATDGPLLVRAALSDSGHMPAADVMLKSPKRGDNYTILVNNGIPGNARVDDVLKRIADKATPWFDSGLKMLSGIATGGSTGSNAPFPQTQTPATGTSSPSGRTIAPQDHPSISGVNPRLVAAVRGGAALALPPGYTVRAVSGHRPGGDPSSHHYKGNASDWQIYAPNGVPIPHKGEDTSGLYTRMARGVRTWALENDPQIAERIGYGGAFGTELGGGGVPDLMHYDLGGSRGNMRPQVQFARLQPLAANERNAPIAGQPAQQAQQPQQVASTQPQAYPPLKPSEAFSPLRAKQPAGVVDPTTQFAVKPVGTIGQGTTFGDIQHTTPRRSIAATQTQTQPPPVVAPQVQAPPLPQGWSHGVLPNGAVFFKGPKGDVQLAPKGWKAPTATTATPAQQADVPIPLPRPRPMTATALPTMADIPIPRPRPSMPSELPSTGGTLAAAAQDKAAERQVVDAPLPRSRPIEADAGVGVSTFQSPVGDAVQFNSLSMPPTGLPKSEGFPFEEDIWSVTPRGGVPELPPIPVAPPVEVPAPPPNVAQLPPLQQQAQARELVPPALPDPSSLPPGSVEPYDENNPDPLPLPELPPIQTATTPDEELYATTPPPTSPTYTTPLQNAASAQAATGTNDVAGWKPLAIPPPNVDGSTQGWKPYAAQTPSLPNAARVESTDAVAPKQSISDMIGTILRGSKYDPASGTGSTPATIDELARKYLDPNVGNRLDRQKVFTDAVQRWVQDQQQSAQTQIIDPIVSSAQKLREGWKTGQPSEFDRVQKALVDWYYGPKKVKTQTIGMPKSATSPTTLSKPNAPNAPASTGMPLPKIPPQVLIPNKGAQGPAFSGPVVGSPNPMGEGGGAKMMPGGGVIAPPIGTGGGAKPPGVPKVADPSSPTGYKYLTPEEAAQLPPVVEEQPVE